MVEVLSDFCLWSPNQASFVQALSGRSGDVPPGTPRELACRLSSRLARYVFSTFPEGFIIYGRPSSHFCKGKAQHKSYCGNYGRSRFHSLSFLLKIKDESRNEKNSFQFVVYRKVKGGYNRLLSDIPRNIFN